METYCEKLLPLKSHKILIKLKFFLSFFLGLFLALAFFLNNNNSFDTTQAATSAVVYKKVFLEISQNSQENTCASVLFLIKLQACEFCEILKNTFFAEHLWVTAFDITGLSNSAWYSMLLPQK